MELHRTVKTAENVKQITPELALQLLAEGNERFVKQQMIPRDHQHHIRQTIEGQHPFAFILGCIDSRVIPEVIFDQGIGDLFVARIAGNIINHGILGSMEYACAVSGSVLIVVLGHTACGAVKGAVDNVKLGHLTETLKPIRNVVKKVKTETGATFSSDNLKLVNDVAARNVMQSIEDIKSYSPVLRELFDKKEINIVGAMYDHTTGEVQFY